MYRKKTNTKNKDRFFKASFISTVGIIITRIVSVLYTIPFAFLISGDAMSINNYSYTIFNQFYELSLAGLPLSIAKLVAKYNSRKQYITSKEIFKLSLWIMTILGIILFLGLFSISQPFSIFKFGQQAGLVHDLSTTIKIISPSLILLPLVSGIRGYLQGFKTMIGSTISQILERISFVVCLLLVLYLCLFRFNFSSTQAISYSYIALPISSIVSLIVLLPFYSKIKKCHSILINKYLKIQKKIKKKSLVKEIIFTAFPFVISGLAATLYATITTLFYENIRISQGISLSIVELEYNSIIFYTNKLISIPLTFSLALSVSIITFVTHAYEKKLFSKVISYIKKSYGMIIFTTFSSCVLMICLGKALLSFFYGYMEDIDLINNILIFDSFRGLLFALETIVISLLQAIDEKNKAMIFTLIGPLTKLIIMYPLILVFGVYGEILSVIISLAFVIYLSTKLIKDKLNIKDSLIFVWIFKTLILIVPSIVFVVVTNSIFANNMFMIYNSRLLNLLYLSLMGFIALVIFVGSLVFIKKYKRSLFKKIINI